MKNGLKSILGGKLSPHELGQLNRSYEIVGDIAIFKTSDSVEFLSPVIAQAIIYLHKQVKTVLRQMSAVSGNFRLRHFEWIAGERKTETRHKEFGCIFQVDLEKCYFSPRLSFERMRVAGLAQQDEVVVNMFAGVGVFSILMAKHSHVKKVYSIDMNPDAILYMKENIRLNTVQGRVIAILGDAKQIITERLSGISDRVIMPLPEKAFEYLELAVMALKPHGGWIHYYDFEHASKSENPVEKMKVKVAEKLRKLGIEFVVSSGRVVRSTGPNWFQVVLDIRVFKSTVSSGLGLACDAPTKIVLALRNASKKSV